MKIKLLLGLSFILLTGFSNVFAVGLPDGAECCNSSECESGFCECSPSDDCARKNDGTVKGNSGICGK